jgi:hypothetical protein
VVGVVVMVGCWPVVQSQPPQAISPASTATTAPRAAAAPASKTNGGAAVKPTAAARPAAAPTRTAAAISAKPTSKPSSAVNSAARTAASPVAVVATSVARLPIAAASPGISTDARAGSGVGTGASSDVLGVATSAVSVANANASDQEAVALCGPGAVLSTRAGQVAGRSATVAIPRVTASYQPNTGGQPTFLNDAPHPNHVFTAVIWGTDRNQFQPYPEVWHGRSVCITGPVELFQQRPQIAVTSPSQLRVVP